VVSKLATTGPASALCASARHDAFWKVRNRVVLLLETCFSFTCPLHEFT
jgi:hypothetical protein